MTKAIKKNRIAIVIHSLAGGGAERVACNLADSLLQKKYEVSVITFVGPAEDQYEINSKIVRYNLEVEHTENSTLHSVFENFKTIKKLRRRLRYIDPDVILSFMSETNVKSILANFGLDSKLIVSERIHPPQFPIGRIWSFLRRYFYRYADCVVVQTGKTRDWVAEYCKGSDVIVIPNAAVWPMPNLPPFVAVDQHVCDETSVILVLAKLRSQKGIHRTLDAFASIPEKTRKGWCIVIAGDGPLLESLQIHSLKLNISDSVIFVGRVGNVSHWYGRADIFAMSSYVEGFPNSLLEAMCAGCAVISMDCDTGPGELIDNNENGILVEQDDIASFSDSLRHLISSSKDRERLGLSAQKVRDKYDSEKILSRWESCINRVTS